MLLSAATRIGRRLERADQPQLLERGLQLRTEHAPLDPLEREQGRLDRGPLALASEVGAKTGAQVAGPADVEHLPVAVAKEVDAGPVGCAPGKGALAVDPPSSWGGERAQVGEPPRPDLLSEPDQVHEHLGSGFRIGKRAVAGAGRNAEEVGERGEADAAQAALEQAAGERGRAERRLGEASTMYQEQLPLEEALVEAGVVRDEEGIAGEGEEAAKNARDERCAPQLLLAQPGEAGDRLRERDSRIHERLKGGDGFECPHANGPELADAAACGREARCLQIEDDELGLLQQWVGSASG